MIIKESKGEIILNSRNETTISYTIKTGKGIFKTSAPNGKSKGKYEAKPWGKEGDGGIVHDVTALNEIRMSEITSIDDIERISKIYSGLVGANTRFALEGSLLKAWAAEHGMQLWELISGGKNIHKMPMPVGNTIGGGLHSVEGKKVSTPEFQEFLFIAGQQTKTFKEAAELNDQAYKEAGLMLKKYDDSFRSEKNDEGAWKTKLTNEHILKIMFIIAKKLGLRVGIDAAASSFYEGFYKYHDKTLNDTGQINHIEHIIDDYELLYVEDPLGEKEFYFFKKLLEKTKEEHQETLIVGDDLTVTNHDRLKKAITEKSINTIIIKPNQNGSIFETGKVVKLAKDHNIKIIVSHRSGETMDDTIADLAVGWDADYIKCGVHGKERRAKINRLLEIERKIQKKKK
ncbi:MAG: hypothetical protein AABW73_04790 [Nanoarchaeota archaeon]